METQNHILIVDDDLYVRDTLSDVLNEAGFTTAGSSTCNEALAEMEKQEADVLLLDIGLSNENGMDFVPEFKKLYPKIPVIILTGSGYERAKMQRVFNDGAMGYICKTINVGGIISFVKSALCEVSENSEFIPSPIGHF